jgi:hypothetical protein
MRDTHMAHARKRDELVEDERDHMHVLVPVYPIRLPDRLILGPKLVAYLHPQAGPRLWERKEIAQPETEG